MDETHTDVVPVDTDVLRTDPGLPPSALVALETGLRSGGAGRGPRSMARRLGWLTSALMLAVVAAAGFIGGVQVQKHQGTTQVSAGTTGGGAGRSGAGAGGAGGAGGATGGTATTVAAGATGAAGAGAAAGARRGAGGGAAAAGGTADTTAAAAGPATGGAAGGARAGFAGGAGAATAGQVKLIDGPNIYVTDATGNVVKVTTSDASRFTHTGAGTINDVHPGDTVVVQGSKGADGIVSATAVADTGATTG